MMNTYFLTFSRKFNVGFFLCFILIPCTCVYSQSNGSLNLKEKKVVNTNYSTNGVEYIEMFAYKSSFLGDNKMSILKIDPQLFDFRLICTSQIGLTKNAIEWMDSLNLNIVFNAGMYNLSDNITNQFYLKNYDHINNSILSPSANGIIAFNPSFDTIPKFQLFDLTMDKWEGIERSYKCIVQGLRMIDCNGNPVFWNNRAQFCSMLVIAQDKSNNIYLIFSRSPYTQNQMIENLVNLPFELINAIYLEGGSRANFVFQSNEFSIQKVGSFVTGYNPNDRNQIFFPFPNFIVLRKIGL